ncbi:MAG TPA: 4a-hydroxytetrahydrobiopterin dehydratase [Kofleriaceae bacterium]|nr:4a-hydroxytetrahydrobiopterin dehydratase [Kofleriaceae bacterium]
MANKLGDHEIKQALAGLEGWTLEGGKLHREYRFADFVHAFAFMTSCALVAEQRNHHPEWSNVWNQVVVDLATHDVGGISELDLAMARTMNELAGPPPLTGA